VTQSATSRALGHHSRHARGEGRAPPPHALAQECAWRQRVARMGEAGAGARAFPGATALVALLRGGWLAVAGAGDCRAVRRPRGQGGGRQRCVHQCIGLVSECGAGIWPARRVTQRG